MNTHGYRLVGKASTVSPDYLPSLIGIDQLQVAPSPTDTYFEQIDLGKVNITSIAVSRWVTYDNAPDPRRDPILGVKADGLSFYIPFTELRDLATEQQDSDILEMLATLPALRALV